MLSLRRSRGLVLVAAVLAAALTARLGWWQLDRAAKKQALGDQIAQRDHQPPLPQTALALHPERVPDQLQRRTWLQGRWLPQHTLFLDNRPMAGRTGFIVLTPLLLASGDAVLVQRGWVPRDFQDRSRLPELPTPSGPVRLAARVAPAPSALFAFGAELPGKIRQNVALADLSREFGLTLRPWSAQQLADAQPLPAPVEAPVDASSGEPGPASSPTPVALPDGLLRDWPAPAVDIGKHHGYAFQWFALSALITGLYVWFQIIQPRRRR